MTNREVIQLFARYEPELIVECFQDTYAIGWHDGYDDEDNAPDFFDKDWLNQEYDNNFFREQDVERLLAMVLSDEYIIPKRKRRRKQRGRTAPNRRRKQ